jgi:hypothetical protein
MQAPIEVSRRAVEKCFVLDILSHRMSEMGIFRKLTVSRELAQRRRGCETRIVPANRGRQSRYSVNQTRSCQGSFTLPCWV